MLGFSATQGRAIACESYGHSALILSVFASTMSLVGQQVREGRPEPFYFVALTDPACPVTCG